MKTIRKYKSKPFAGITAEILQLVSADMLPLYKAIASKGPFALEWSKAIVGADLTRLHELMETAAPAAAKQGYGTNGIGYFISFGFPSEGVYYTNGVTIPPGTARFTFPYLIHRRLAKAVIPFYRELACNKPFAEALAKAIRSNNRRIVSYMVRSLITTSSLKSVTLENYGIALQFKFSGSRNVYRNLIILEAY